MKIFLHAWTGSVEKGLEFVRARYPSAQISIMVHREMRESGWSGQLRILSKLRGKAVVFFFHSLADVKEPEIFIGSHLVHHCSESVLADEAGEVRIINWRECARCMPRVIASAIADVGVFLVTWFLFRNMKKRRVCQLSAQTERALDIAYIYPYPLNRDFAGGATTHFKGFLQGLDENMGSCIVLSGCKIPFQLPFPVLQIPTRRKRYIFSESLILSYNWSFAREARKLLRGRKPGVVYQRHGRFVIAGMLLARSLGVPFVLEYNGSEVWMADHWDPARFLPWLRLAEEIALSAASTIVTVSLALKNELIGLGISDHRILVNPNGVDPSKFLPDDDARKILRQQLNLKPDDVVVAFAGTFSYWHGIEILQKAIKALLGNSGAKSAPGTVHGNLRFLLIGKGPLQAEMRAELQGYEARKQVIFTGPVPHAEMPGYLNAADLLVSPQIPMPDGRPFIGSPTKLFEYMAIGKAIVASRLDQLELVLEHNRTALLVRPGDVDELVNAILLAAGNEPLRNGLGRSAREVALKSYTWKRNAAETMSAAGLRSAPPEVISAALDRG